jgi:hypothetical protein
MVVCFFLDSEYLDVNYEPDFSSYQNEIDSLQKVVENIDSSYHGLLELQTQKIKYFDSLHQASEKKYDSLFSSLDNITVDEHMLILSNELSKEDNYQK